MVSCNGFRNPALGAKVASSVAEPETIRERGGQLREAGAEYLIVYLPRLAHDLEQMQRFQEEIIPHFAR